MYSNVSTPCTLLNTKCTLNKMFFLHLRFGTLFFKDAKRFQKFLLKYPYYRKLGLVTTYPIIYVCISNDFAAKNSELIQILNFYEYEFCIKIIKIEIGGRQIILTKKRRKVSMRTVSKKCEYFFLIIYHELHDVSKACKTSLQINFWVPFRKHLPIRRSKA